MGGEENSLYHAMEKILRLFRSEASLSPSIGKAGLFEQEHFGGDRKF
jgi:hypothetical protein